MRYSMTQKSDEVVGYCGVSLFVSSYILMFSALAVRYGVGPYVSLATRTLVRGQPRSGLLCVLCKLLLLMFSALIGKHKRFIFCSYVLLFLCSPR